MGWQHLLLPCIRGGLQEVSIAFQMVCCRNRSQTGDFRIPSDILQSLEQTDLIKYGLIPEFVGRFPVLCSLQVGL